MRTAFAALALSLVLTRPAPIVHAAGAAPTTDANLVTALDVSDSIMRHEEWIEFDGIARAVVDPAFLKAILAGRHGRIGFAVYTWSSHGHARVIVPWTLIGSGEDAERVARLLRGAPRIDRSRSGGGDHDADIDEAPSPSLLTDISAAIGFGLGFIASAPQRAERTVLNIAGNGIDNVGEGPRRARALALASGVTINGLVLGDEVDVAAHYRDHVVGGRGAFVLRAGDPAGFADAMAAKFLMDLIAGRGGAGWPFGAESWT